MPVEEDLLAGLWVHGAQVTRGPSSPAAPARIHPPATPAPSPVRTSSSDDRPRATPDPDARGARPVRLPAGPGPGGSGLGRSCGCRSGPAARSGWWSSSRNLRAAARPPRRAARRCSAPGPTRIWSRSRNGSPASTARRRRARCADARARRGDRDRGRKSPWWQSSPRRALRAQRRRDATHRARSASCSRALSQGRADGRGRARDGSLRRLESRGVVLDHQPPAAPAASATTVGSASARATADREQAAALSRAHTGTRRPGGPSRPSPATCCGRDRIRQDRGLPRRGRGGAAGGPVGNRART